MGVVFVLLVYVFVFVVVVFVVACVIVIVVVRDIVEVLGSGERRKRKPMLSQLFLF